MGDVQLQDLAISAAYLTALHEGGLKTVGELTDWQAVGEGRELIELKGMGPVGAAEVADRLATFREEHPKDCQELAEPTEAEEDSENTLPPVRCPRPDCGAVMELTASGYVVCSTGQPHNRLKVLPEDQRADWRTERRKLLHDIELAVLPVAMRTVYRIATPDAPGRHLHTILDKPGIWFLGSGQDSIKASCGGKKYSFVRAATSFEEELLVLAGLLVEPEAAADGAPEA